MLVAVLEMEYVGNRNVVFRLATQTDDRFLCDKSTGKETSTVRMQLVLKSEGNVLVPTGF